MQIGEHTAVRSSSQTASGHGTATPRRGDGPRVLEPRSHGLAPRAGARMAGHPVVAFVAVSLVGFVVLAAAAVLAGWLLETYVLPDHGIGHADERVNVWLAHHRTASRNDISYWMSGIGDVYAIPAIVALTALIAAVARRWRVAGFIIAAVAIEAATYRVVTLVIHRERPRVPRLDDLPVNASYYSGHTAASVAVYCGVALLLTARIRGAGRKALVWLVAVAIPLLVGFSRMYRGMHHPTDVAAGLLVGIGALAVAVTAARAARSAEARAGGKA
jgi:membrane-associated phospholipid phosphatase